MRQTWLEGDGRRAEEFLGDKSPDPSRLAQAYEQAVEKLTP
ncbi:MAG: hypothetical protein QM757_46100 [Paludibaculum sp.]